MGYLLKKIHRDLTVTGTIQCKWPRFFSRTTAKLDLYGNKYRLAGTII